MTKKICEGLAFFMLGAFVCFAVVILVWAGISLVDVCLHNITNCDYLQGNFFVLLNK